MDGTTVSHVNNLMTGLVLLAVLCSLASGTVEKWRHPCSSGQPSTTTFTVPVLTTMSPEIMIPILNEAADAAASLKEKYVLERFSGRSVAMMNSQTFQGMPQSTTEQEVISSFSNVTLAHVSNYDKLSRLLAFLEPVTFDETYLDGSNEVYRRALATIEEKILNTLCNKKKIIESAGADIDYVSRTIVPDYVQSCDSSYERKGRDYIIVKDTHRVLHAMWRHVTAIHNHLSQGI